MTLYFHTLFAVLYLVGFTCVPASLAEKGTRSKTLQPLSTLAPNAKESVRAWRTMVRPTKTPVTHRVTCNDTEVFRIYETPRRVFPRKLCANSFPAPV